ncbi:putative membrane protein [Comamonas sp. BIGb0124]|uniref:bestrophin family protein n=1 Tax=Comamonas sp. BIGb0124 TaxID=2485130 RepID=UPI000F4A49BC|nr:bestrophin family ion channel [Comamonas sp. BIGb0124]ROR22743.1 putative membrane protein [Comamonas sp. BIGb0124]
MIVRPHLNWLRMLFVVRGSILRNIAPQLIITTALAVLVTHLHGQLLWWKVPLNFVPFSLIGLTLAIFLGFRNSTSYARYWEARMLWGALLVETRALVRQSLTLIDDAPSPAGPDGPTGGVRALARLLAAFTHAFKHQMRGTDPTVDLDRLLELPQRERLSGVRFKPAMLLLMVGEWLRDRRREGRLSPVLVPTLERSVARLGEALGGCERIASTPIPFPYSVIIHRTVYFYCVMLPFGLVDSIGSMTPVIVAFIAYTFFALEALGAEIEQPFGTELNDLPLDALSRTIENNLREALGETLLPEPEAQDYVLT